LDTEGVFNAPINYNSEVGINNIPSTEMTTFINKKDGVT